MKKVRTLAKDEIALGEVAATDAIAIRTRNSVYHFLVVNPSTAYGVVSGGAVGPRPAAGALLCDSRRLSVGAPARLLVESGAGCRFVTTSAVVGLTHFKSG